MVRIRLGTGAGTGAGWLFAGGKPAVFDLDFRRLARQIAGAGPPAGFFPAGGLAPAKFRASRRVSNLIFAGPAGAGGTGPIPAVLDLGHSHMKTTSDPKSSFSE